jgi:hypothetical protein
MASSSTAGIILPSRLKEAYTNVTCPYPACKANIEYQNPSTSSLASLPSSETSFRVTCCTCKQRFEPPGAPRLVREAKQSNGKDKPKANKRRIGTDEKPLDTT